MSNGCALASTAAVPVAKPSTPANMAAKAMLPFVAAISRSWPVLRLAQSAWDLVGQGMGGGGA